MHHLKALLILFHPGSGKKTFILCYGPDLIFGFISQQIVMLAFKLVPHSTLEIKTSIYVTISTFKGGSETFYKNALCEAALCEFALCEETLQLYNV